MILGDEAGPALAVIFEERKSYARYHFADEERLMGAGVARTVSRAAPIVGAMARLRPSDPLEKMSVP